MFIALEAVCDRHLNPSFPLLLLLLQKGSQELGAGSYADLNLPIRWRGSTSPVLILPQRQSLRRSKERSVCSPLGLCLIGSDCPPCTSLSLTGAVPKCRAWQRQRSAGSPRRPTSSLRCPLALVVLGLSRHHPCCSFLRLMLLSIGRPVPLVSSLAPPIFS